MATTDSNANWEKLAEEPREKRVVSQLVLNEPELEVPLTPLSTGLQHKVLWLFLVGTSVSLSRLAGFQPSGVKRISPTTLSLDHSA